MEDEELTHFGQSLGDLKHIDDGVLLSDDEKDGDGGWCLANLADNSCRNLMERLPREFQKYKNVLYLDIEYEDEHHFGGFLKKKNADTGEVWCSSL